MGNKVNVQFVTQNQKVTVEAGSSLLDVCRASGIRIEAACNGKGICGACRVRAVQGDVPVTDEDKRFFTQQELEEGYRLACRAKLAADLAVQVEQGPQADIKALGMVPAGGAAQATESVQPVSKLGCMEARQKGQASVECCIAVDLGSTTLAAVLLLPDGEVLAQASAVNSQRMYGADVLSRIQASNEGKREELQNCICRDLEQLFQTLLSQALLSNSLGGGPKRPMHVSRIAIAGNTAMFHLLRGYSCKMLGQAPFTPEYLGLECLKYPELFSQVPGCMDSSVYLLPGMSAFIGSDITAGLYSSGFWKRKEESLACFIDLGTNGEMAFGSRSGFLTASAAAGPAFEGGRLSCGVAGVAGAISKVSFLYHRVRVQTIGQKKPCGVCGTGALSALEALLQEGRMDADGLLAPDLYTDGLELARRPDGSRICLTQADIREIQMAKAAIRAGVEVLQQQYPERFHAKGPVEAGSVYLAGGFGYYLPPETAVAIGLFPAEWKSRVVSCGNTSLKGAAAFLTDAACAGSLEEICQRGQNVRLEDSPYFEGRYVQAMRFPDA